MANYREPQWLLPNEKNLAMPASDATVGSGLAEDRHSLYSMDFDGVDDYIDVAFTNFPENLLDNFSVSFWVKIPPVPAGVYTRRHPVSVSTSVTANDQTVHLRAWNTQYRVRIIGSVTPTGGVGTTDISDNQWHNITYTYTYDSSTTYYTVNVYVDGNTTPEVTATMKTTGGYATRGLHTIGVLSNYANPYSKVAGTYLPGRIDEVAAWNRSLSISEITTIYNSGAPGNLMALSDKPVAYWPLSEQARLGSEWQFPNEVLQSQVFDFTNSADDININNGISLGTVHSVNFWVNFAAPYSTRDAYILSSGTVNGWVVYATNGGLLYYKAGSSTYSSGTMTAPTAAGVGKWHNITITRNGANINFYQNGNTTPFATTSSFAGASTALGDIDFISGDRSYGSDIRYSNFTFYDIELSPAQVEQAYNNGSPLSTPVQQSNLKAWYKLNATSNYAGLNPNFHNALSFDGSSSQYVIAPLDGKGTGSSPFASGSDLEFTVSFWYFRESSSSQIGVFQWAIPLSSGNPFLLVQQNSNDLKVYYDNNYRTTTTTTTNGWYNITMTRTSSDNIFKAYLNGVEFISYDDGGTIVNQSNAESVYFGNGYNGYFTGKISNAAVWTQAISAEDVLYLYNGGTPQTSLSFEPLSWWKLDNLTTGIQDSGSASNNGTNNGATAVSSSVAVDQWNFDNVSQAQTPNWSSALDFVSSSTQYIDLTNTGFPTGAASRTVSAWIKADSSGQNNEQGIIKYGTTSTRQLFMMSLAATTGQLRVSTYGDDLTYTTADLRDDTWHHVALTYDGTSIKGYVDGSYVGVETNTLVNTSNNSPAIGNWNGAGFTFNGAISNVILYTETLTDANILALYNNGSPQSTPYGSPFGWWKLDNTASGINDSGSGGNNGTLQNAPTEIQTNVWTPRLNGESTTLPSTALVSSDLQFESPYSNFSLDFDAASSNYIDCTTNLGDTLGVVTNLSVSMWIKADVTSGNDFTFNIGSFSNSYGMVALQLLSNNLYIRLNDNARYLQKSFSSNDWNNIIFVYDGSNVNNTYLYINGEKQTLDGSGGVHPTSLDLSGLKTIIGAGYSSSYSFDGKIDETAIWSSALTQAQVSQVYNNGYPADLTSLSPVSWWRLGEDAYFVSPNFTVPNQITGAPNGTSANMDQADLVADAPGSYASGVGSSLALADRVGDAPESTANSLSFNMTPLNKISYPSGYVPTQADNVYSMAFDGVSDYFNLGTSLNSTINGVVNNFSISCWIKADAGSGSVRRGIIGNYTTASATGFYLDLINSSANAFTLRAGYHGASGYNLRDNTTTLVANGSTWYNVIVTVSGNTSGDVVVYINGIAENGTTIFSSPSSYTVTANLEVGHIAHGPSNRFSGDIDEVAIFDYALSARQIKQDIYEGTTTGKTADLNNISNLTAPVAWYRMGD